MPVSVIKSFVARALVPAAPGFIPALVMALLLAPLPMSAHHSAAAEYQSRLVTVRGTVLQFQWRNPHVFINVETRDATGAVQKLLCEANGPGALIENGWTKDTLKPGDKITLEGYPAKYRPNGFKVHAVILPGGRRLLME